MKKKITTLIIILATVILAGVAVFTAIRLYQLRQQPVAPNVPSSRPRAQTVPTPTPASCRLTFSLSTSTPTGSPTATPTGTSTPTGTPTSTPTGTATATPTTTGVPNNCNGTCGSNNNCQSTYFCYQGRCRNSDCPTDADCVCGAATATPAPTEAALPQAGTSFPTILGVGLGTFILLGSLLLAL